MFDNLDTGQLLAIAALILLTIGYVSKKIGPWMLKRRMDRMLKASAGVIKAPTMSLTDNQDTRLLVELINRCIAYGDYVALKANFIFEGEEGDKLPHLWIKVCRRENKECILFQSEVEANAAMLVWHRVTRENGFQRILRIGVEFNPPERKRTGGGVLA